MDINPIKKVRDLAEKKKQNLLERIESRSSLLLLLNWLLTNWITILLVIVLSFLGINQYIKYKDIQELLLKKEIEVLVQDLEKAKKEKEKLLGRVKDLENTKKEAYESSKKLKKQVKNIPLDKKKEKLLEYKDRLIRKKGL